MNRVLLEPTEVGDGGLVSLQDYRARHLLDVLRVTPGREVRIGLLNGPTGTAVVSDVKADSVLLECRFETVTPAAPPVDLLLALPRPKVMRRLWAPLASLGVGRIVLTNAEKVERQYFDTQWLDEPVYRRELVHGLEQAGDTILPEVLIRRRLKPLVEDELDSMFPEHARLLANPGPGPTDFSQFGWKAKVLVAVGPEGGWTKFETDLLLAHGFRSVCMGPRTLRTDTACIALLALIHAARAYNR